MTVALWIALGILNGIALFLLEPHNSQKNLLLAAGVGVMGSLAGGMVAYMLLGGRVMEITTPLMLIFSFELLAMFYVITSKRYRSM